jgi:hypothetical protein
MKSIVELINEMKGMDDLRFADRFGLASLDAAYEGSILTIGCGDARRQGGNSLISRKLGASMRKALAKNTTAKPARNSRSGTLRVEN